MKLHSVFFKAFYFDTPTFDRIKMDRSVKVNNWNLYNQWSGDIVLLDKVYIQTIKNFENA